MKKFWSWILGLLAKAWDWIKNIDWCIMIDSKEFLYFFPLGVFFILMALHFTNPVLYLPFVIWCIVIYRGIKRGF